MNHLRYTLFSLVLLLALSNTTFAQPVSGTKTVGQAPSDYASLTAAFAAITANGINGHVILELKTNYPTGVTETFPLAPPTNADADSTITIRPAAGTASALNISSGNTTSTFTLNGANYIIVDGRPGGIGTSRFITLNNTSTAATTVQFINDANHNILRYCNITGRNQQQNEGIVYFGTSTGTNGNDSNTIEYSNIADNGTLPEIAILSEGTSGKSNIGNTISNNLISNYTTTAANEITSGLYLVSFSDQFTISNNRFFQTATRTQNQSVNNRAICLLTGAHTISNNIIGYASATGTGKTTVTSNNGGHKFVGIFLSVSTASPTSIQGNQIAEITLTSSNNLTTIGNNIFNGIYVAEGRVNIGTVTPNLIGSLTAASSITITASSTTANTYPACGILSNGTANITIQNNQLGGITIASTGNRVGLNLIRNASTGTIVISSNALGGSLVNNIQLTGGTNAQLIGIRSSNGVATINSNTIQSLTHTGANVNNAANSALIGILYENTTSTNITINSNTIDNLISTSIANANISVIGIRYSGPSSGTNNVSSNTIRRLVLNCNGATPIMNGIDIAAGNTTFANNEIALGFDRFNSSLVAPISIRGINEGAGQNSFYYNSVHIGGIDVANGNNTRAFSSDVTGTRDVRNNAFVNTRSYADVSATRYNAAAVYSGTLSGGALSGLTSNYNLYYAPNTGGVVVHLRTPDVAYVTLANWTTVATTHDGNSVSGDPLFNTNTYLLPVSSSTALVAGISIGGITTDIDGVVRSLPRMGCYESAGDSAAPEITLTFLTRTSSLTDRVITANITDFSGVPTSGALQPKIYYRKNSGAWQNNQGTLASGTGTAGSWNFTLSSAAMGGVSINDTINFYVIAQDGVATPNISSNPSGVVATDVNTIVTPPASVNSYLIVNAIGASSFTVCPSGCDYSSLTGAGGLFQSINSNILSVNTTITIVDSILETGVHPLNNDGLGGFHLSIVPADDTVKTIANASNLSQAMLRFNGARNVTINGSFNGVGQYFRIINTHTTPASCQAAILFTNGAQNDTLKGSIIETNATNATLGSVVIGTTGTINNISITQNLFRNAIGTPGTAGNPVNAIYGNSANYSNIVIGGPTLTEANEFRNYTGSGVLFASAGNQITIQRNYFYHTIANGTTNLSHISITNGNEHTILGNSIGGSNTARSGVALATSGTHIGIALNVGAAFASNIQGNTISNFGNQANVGTTVGIQITNGLVNIGTSIANTIGGGANAYDTLRGGTSLIGIVVANGTATIENNTIGNMFHYNAAANFVLGVNHTGGIAYIRNNTIRNLTGNSTQTGGADHPLGIHTNVTTTGNEIIGNTIHSITNTNSNASIRAMGMRISNTGGSITIAQNRIYGMNAPNAATANIKGIWIISAVNATIHNNMISLSPTIGTPTVECINLNATANGTNLVVYNNLYIGGSTSSGASKSYGIIRNPISTTSTIQNNILYNERTGGTGGHFALGVANNAVTISNNVLITASTSTVGEVGTTAYNFADFNTNSGQTASKNGLSLNYPATTFFTSTSTGNLTSANCISSNSGTAVSITTDYTGTTRSASTPDIGANEFATIQNTWTGATSSNYNIATNWCAGSVPTATDTFTIASAANLPALSASTTIHTVTLNSGTRLDLNGQQLTLNGTINGLGTLRTNAASSLVIAGTGAAGTIRIDQSNPGSTNVIGALTLNRGTSPASGSATLAGTLRIDDSLVVTNGTLNTGDSLVLLSAATKTARISRINTGNAAISGQVVAQRFISSQGRRWRFLSSPVVGATVADLKNEIHITGPGTGTTIGTENSNGFDATPGNVASIFSYSESVAGVVNNGWTTPVGKTDSLRVGRGYRVFVRGPRSEGNGLLDGSLLTQNAVTLDARGTPNYGNYKPGITYTNTGTPAADGWNLVGNPYASPLSWNAIHDAGRSGSFPNYSGTDYLNLSPVVYVLNAVSNKYDSYNANSDTGTLTGGLIPSMSSFFIIAQAATAELNLRETHKSAGTPMNIFKTGGGNGVGIKLYETPSEFDQFIFKPISDASPLLDGYDIPKLNNPNINISSWGVDGRYLSLDCRPLELDTIQIPLAVRLAKSGTFHMDLNGAELFEYEARLEDNFTKTSILIGTNTSYDFAVSSDTASSGDFRFKLVFTKLATSVQSFASTSVLLKSIAYPNPVKDQLSIAYYNNNAPSFTIELIDLIGRVHYQQKYSANTEGIISLDMQAMAAGVYFVKITLPNGNVINTNKIVK